MAGVLLPCALMAQLSTYSFKRKLENTNSEDYYSIPLSPDITAKSLSDLADLRIYHVREKDSVEVPYIYEWQGRSYEEKREVPFQLINVSQDATHSYATLKFDGKKIIELIQLDIAELNFDKYIELQGSNDNRSWETIRMRARILRIYNDHVNYGYSTLRFQPAEYSYFRLVMDDSDGKRITINKANAYEPVSVKGEFTELKSGGFKRTENKENKTTELLFELDKNYRVASIELLPGKEKDFYRNVNVYYVTSVTKAPKGDIENWSLLTASVLSVDESCSIECFDRPVNKLKIEIVNNDDQPVQVEKIRAYAGNSRLVTKLPASENIYLVYGKAGDNGPRYDMEHFADKIPDKLTTLLPGDEMMVKQPQAEKAIEPLISNKVWLWVAMGGILLLLGIFSLRMLKNEGKG